MIWFLERGVELCVCEARHEGEAFELAIMRPDGTERVERFENPSVLLERFVDCQQGLRRDGWRLLNDEERHLLVRRVEEGVGRSL
jgi:hypothetical protein